MDICFRDGLEIEDLAATAGDIDYVSAGMALKRFEQRLPSDQPLAKIVPIAESKLVEMLRQWTQA